MPGELIHAILEEGSPWSHRDVLALSQSAPAIDHLIGALQPDAYQEAHQPTLHRAFNSKRFNFDNRRAKAVLGRMHALHLLGSPKPQRLRHSCDPTTVEWAHLERIVSATGAARALYFGGLTHSLAPLWKMGMAGLDVANLTTLCLDQAGFVKWSHVDWLHSAFARMPALEVLHMPRRLTDHSMLEVFSFAPLTALRELTWEMQSGPIAKSLEIGANAKLKVFKFSPCAPTPASMLGPALSIEDLVVDMPQSRLEVLHLQNVALTGPLTRLLSAPPWQNSLVELKLCADLLATPLDLSGHTALTRLRLTPHCANLQQLTLPPPSQLEQLEVQGDDIAPVLRQLEAAPAPSLRRLALSSTQAIIQVGHVPWAHLAAVEAFTFQYHPSFERTLASLNIPANNRIRRLTLTGQRIGHSADRALGSLWMPRLQVLDISGLRLYQATVRGLDEAFAERARWPLLEELVVRLKYVRRPIREALWRLAADHKLRLTVE